MEFSELTAELVAVTLEHLGRDARLNGDQIRVIWAPYMDQPMIGQIRTSLEEPSVFVRQSLAATIDDGAVLTFEGCDYKVVNRDPAQNGLVHLILRPDYD